MGFTTSLHLGGHRCITSVPKGTAAWRKATTVFCPLGRAPTQAWVLLTRDKLLLLDVGSTHSLVWEQQGSEGTASNTLTFPGLYIVKAEKVLPGAVNDFSMYLVELADSRWKASTASDTEIVRANLRSYANESSYLTGTSGYTWESLGQQLWEACEHIGAWPGLPFAPDSVPQNTIFTGMNGWRALCSFLEQLDCAVKHNPLTNIYTIEQLGVAQAIEAHTETTQWSGAPLDIGGVASADTLRVYFHQHRKSYGQERDVELASNWLVGDGIEYLQVATGIAGSSGTKAVWEDLPWILDENNAHTNLADCEARRDARKARYILRQGVDPVHRVHAGLLNDILPGGQVRAVCWHNWDDLNDSDIGGTVTEFVCQNEMVSGYKALEFGPAWFDSELTTPEREPYSPPDLGRHSFPNYPRLPNVVQVRNAGYAANEMVDPNADGFHPGKVRRWVANDMAILEDCWIRFVDQHDDLNGEVQARNYDLYGPARLSGVSTSGAVLLPVYIVRRGDADRIARFKLTAALNTGSNTTAVIRTFDGTTYNDGEAIKVFDWWAISQTGRGMWQGFTGMEGWAIRREKNADLTPGAPPEYDIVWMEQYAFWVEGTLTSLFDEEGVATATVTASWHQGVEPGSSITVHDDHDPPMFPRAVAGSNFSAARSEYADPDNPDVPYYKVIQCQQIALTARAILAEVMCGSGEFAITSFTVTSHSPYNMDISPGTAFNDFAHKGEAGDTIWLQWDDTLFDYVITNVTKKNQTVVFDVRVFGDYIQTFETECAVEYCQPPSWVDKIPLEDCETLGDPEP